MNWRIRLIKALVRQLRTRDDFKLRLGHSLVLQNPARELYMEIVYGPDEVSVMDVTFNPEVWGNVQAGMGEMLYRIGREYEPVEEGT